MKYDELIKFQSKLVLLDDWVGLSRSLEDIKVAIYENLNLFYFPDYNSRAEQKMLDLIASFGIHYKEHVLPLLYLGEILFNLLELVMADELAVAMGKFVLSNKEKEETKIGIGIVESGKAFNKVLDVKVSQIESKDGKHLKLLVEMDISQPILRGNIVKINGKSN
ncbi:hypothetical protein ACH5RR_026352 [Cinchona calisaya]|uniref:Uncharacterized protein n=1 Tax=Cinchona calisaya TaxID=153742 RepID=A0ABD2Z2B6_9GENT